MKPLSTEQKLHLNHDVIVLALLFGFCFWINRGMSIQGLAADDLYVWTCFKEQTFFQYVFPIGGPRFRCLYYLISWLEMAIVGSRVEWLVPINLVLNSLLATLVYCLGKRLSGRRVLGFFGGIFLLMSRMAFYQIGQMTGLAETIAFFLAVGLIYCLYVYLHEKQEKIWYFHGACGFYFALCFVHERFIFLVLLFFLVLCLKKRFQLRKWFWPLRQFLLVLAIRFLAMGREAFVSLFLWERSKRGEDFSWGTIFQHMKEQLAYLFGVNMGPKYLNALAWEETPQKIRGLVYASDFLLAVFLTVCLVKAVKSGEEKFRIFSESLLFFTFIILCMLSCSFAGQVEVPWVYVSYGGFILFILYLCGAVLPTKKNQEENRTLNNGWAGNVNPAGSGGDSAEANYLSMHAHQQHKKDFERWGLYACTCGFVLYLVLMFPVEQFFRSHYDNLYFWGDQVKYNSLAEETYGKYGSEIFGKTIYIIGDRKEVSQQAKQSFFQVFAGPKEEKTVELEFINSILDIGLVTKQMLVLRMDKENGIFQDVTQFVKELKFNPKYGIYADGWTDESCRFMVLSGETGVIRLRFLYPGQLDGDEQTEVYVDGELWQKISVTENIYVTEIQAGPYQTLDVEIKNNFFVEDALEQRGSKRLTAILEIETE